MSNNTIHVGVVNFFDTSTPTCQTVANNASTKVNGAYQYAVKDLWDCYKTDETVLINYNGKLQFQENAANKSTFTVTDGIKTRNARGADAFHPLITTRRQDGPTIFYRGEHQWIVSNRLTMTAQYLHISENWGQFFQNDGLEGRAGDPVRRHRLLRSQHRQRQLRHAPAAGRHPGGRELLRVELPRRRSLDEVRLRLPPLAGGIADHVRRRRQHARPLDRQLQANCTVGGVTALCNEADIKRDADFSYILYGRSLYWNDSYKKSKTTINVGLRFDRQFDIVRAATTPANVILPDLLPGLSYPGADSGARYNNLSPRGGHHLRPARQRQERAQGERRALLRPRHVYREHAAADQRDDAALRVAGPERRQQRSAQRARHRQGIPDDADLELRSGEPVGRGHAGDRRSEPAQRQDRRS